MLGNKYFIARKYANAASNFQQSLVDTPGNKAVRKKLIICYTQIYQIKNVLEIIEQLIEEDIDFIINTNQIEDACPCPDLIKKYGSIIPFAEYSIDLKLMLGMLLLYCNAEKLLVFFREIQKEDSTNKSINSILSIIEKRLVNKQYII